MNGGIEGARPRPRLALVGTFDDDTLSRFKTLFPTVWSAKVFAELEEQVDYREIDVLVIGADVQVEAYAFFREYLDNSHIICFSADVKSLPGPCSNTWVRTEGVATTEEYELPTVSLPAHRRRELDLSSISSVRGWVQLNLVEFGVPAMSVEKLRELREGFKNRAIVLDHHAGVPLGAVYWRDYNNLAVAWLPQTVFSQYEWVEILSMDWAESDAERFPGFGDWTKYSEWMLPEEIALVDRINSLEEQKLHTIREIDEEIGRFAQELTRVTLGANQGRRRLLTAQNDDLVEEVKAVFSEIGFEVQMIDQRLEANVPRREDLRLGLPDEENWEAIVEVRGYTKSGGKTSDLYRLGRFAALFEE